MLLEHRVRRAPGAVQAHVAHHVSPVACGPGASVGSAPLPGAGAGLPSGLSLEMAWNTGVWQTEVQGQRATQTQAPSLASFPPMGHSASV